MEERRISQKNDGEGHRRWNATGSTVEVGTPHIAMSRAQGTEPGRGVVVYR